MKYLFLVGVEERGTYDWYDQNIYITFVLER